MNILCSCDNNYAPYCGIMLTSLFENNRESEVVVYILTNKVSEENIGKLRKLAESYGQTIHFIEVSDEMTTGFPLSAGSHVSMATYYRLFVTSILPADVDKILYLDCDIIVNRSLSEAYNTDLTNKSAGVVLDCGYFDGSDSSGDANILNDNSYFNAGVLLINLNYWREHDLQIQFIRYIESHKNKLYNHDNDVLNGVLQNTVTYLPIIYNFQTVFLFKKHFCIYPKDMQERIQNCNEENIVLFHYLTPVKPWNCWHFAYPFDSVWQRYKKHSLWSDTKYKQPWKQRINCWMVKTLCRLGIKEINL